MRLDPTIAAPIPEEARPILAALNNALRPSHQGVLTGEHIDGADLDNLDPADLEELTTLLDALADTWTGQPEADAINDVIASIGHLTEPDTWKARHA